MNIHLIGDSHVIMHMELEPKIICTHCGACTSYSLMTPKSATGSFQTLKHLYSKYPPQSNKFIFLFGEIDCRVLIHFISMEYSMSTSDIIDMAVYRYHAAISFCRDHGYDVGIHGIIPAVRQTNEYGVKHYGDEAVRALINMEFNQKCKRKAEREEIPYFDCFDVPGMMADDGLVPRDSLLPDMVHIDPKKVHIAFHFIVWLKQKGFIPLTPYKEN